MEIKELDPVGRYVLKATVFMTWTSVYDIVYILLSSFHWNKRITDILNKSHTTKNNPKKNKEYVKKGKTEKTKGDYKRFNFCELRNHTAFFFLIWLLLSFKLLPKKFPRQNHLQAKYYSFSLKTQRHHLLLHHRHHHYYHHYYHHNSHTGNHRRYIYYQ